MGVNVLAVVVAAAASMGLGAWWYSPKGFGREWMRLSGMTEKKMKGMTLTPAQGMGLGFLTQLVMAYVFALLLKGLNWRSLEGGLALGFWAWLGFVVTISLGVVLWEGKPWKLWALNGAYYLVSFLVMGAIIGAW